MSRPHTLAAAAAVLLLLLAGCSSDEPTPGSSSSSSDGDAQGSGSLAEFAAMVQQQTEKNFDAFSDTYSAVEITADGESTLVYRYTHLEAQEPAAAQERLEATREVAQSAMEAGLLRQMEEAGIVSPRVREIHLNPDGTTVTDETFPAP